MKEVNRCLIGRDSLGMTRSAGTVVGVAAQNGASSGRDWRMQDHHLSISI